MSEVKAFKLSWDEVADSIGLEVSSIIERKITCKANVDDCDYWAIQILEERIPLSELFKLMETVNADEAARKDSLPESAFKEFSTREIGMRTAELLLSRHLGCVWETIHISGDALWLLGVKGGDHGED